MKNPLKKKLTNALLTVEPGRYLTARGEKSFHDIDKPTPGLVLDTTPCEASDELMATVLVNGITIIMWTGGHGGMSA